MKLFLFSVSFSLMSISYGGGFVWPNIEYDYTKLHLMNIPWDEKERPEHDIYRDGIYASSKVGDGFDLSTEFMNAFHGIMVRGMDELIYGLSKCYVPRHGIIYYDKMGEPVASVSICFECQRLEFWSKNELHLHKPNPEKFDIDRAEKQMQSMINLFKRHDLPYFEQPLQYQNFVDSNDAFVNNGEMFFHLDEHDTLFNTYFSKGQNWLWVHKNHKKAFQETVEMKITAGGDKIMYNQFSDGKGTRFIYMDGLTHMTEATIISNLVTLPNGIKIGMSTDQVVGSFPVYDGIAWPAMISQEFPKYTLEYHFKRRTLVRIEMRSK